MSTLVNVKEITLKHEKKQGSETVTREITASLWEHSDRITTLQDFLNFEQVAKRIYREAQKLTKQDERFEVGIDSFDYIENRYYVWRCYGGDDVSNEGLYFHPVTSSAYNTPKTLDLFITSSVLNDLAEAGI